MSDNGDAREVIRTWLRRHDYPSDPSWQINNLLCDLRAAFGSEMVPPAVERAAGADTCPRVELAPNLCRCQCEGCLYSCSAHTGLPPRE